MMLKIISVKSKRDIQKTLQEKFDRELALALLESEVTMKESNLFSKEDVEMQKAIQNSLQDKRERVITGEERDRQIALLIQESIDFSEQDPEDLLLAKVIEQSLKEKLNIYSLPID